MTMKHGPYCIEPDEVGDSGYCVCDGTDETIAAMQAEYDRVAATCKHPNTAAAPGLARASVWCPDCLNWVVLSEPP